MASGSHVVDSGFYAVDPRWQGLGSVFLFSETWIPDSNTASYMEHSPAVKKVDNAIHRINLYPVDSAIGFANTYPLDNDLSGG